MRASRTQALAFDGAEFDAGKWFRFDEIPFERSDPHLRRFIDKLRRRLAPGQASLKPLPTTPTS